MAHLSFLLAKSLCSPGSGGGQPKLIYYDIFSLTAVCKGPQGDVLTYPLCEMPGKAYLCWTKPDGEIVESQVPSKYKAAIMKRPAAMMTPKKAKEEKEEDQGDDDGEEKNDEEHDEENDETPEDEESEDEEVDDILAEEGEEEECQEEAEEEKEEEEDYQKDVKDVQEKGHDMKDEKPLKRQ